MHISVLLVSAVVVVALCCAAESGQFAGRYCWGTGDVGFLQLVNRSFGFFHPNPDDLNISMLYRGDWDCLVEGPQWGGWWIQNSYGPTWCALPFLAEPWIGMLQRSQDMWFAHQGDGKSAREHGLVAPDGALCDCATPDTAHMVQGDCRWDIHDWGFEFTAAGVVMQAELLLISRDTAAIRRYLPNLGRACDFIETRRDPASGLFSVGPSANLLAPSYAGVRLADGTFGRAYLAGLSVSCIAAYDRMIEIYRLIGDAGKEASYRERRETTRASLPRLVGPDGCFVKYVEPDGTLHGVYGHERYGYFESVVNVDAIAFRVANDRQSDRIYWRIASLPELRPHDYLIPNYPSLDDTYENWGSTELGGLWEYGRWVNGGVWSTVEARTIMAYYRLGKTEDVRRVARRSMQLADDFQMDAPLPDFGGEVWWRDRQTNLCYDALGIPAATVRGLFEYIYGADTLTLYPHVPRSVDSYVQCEPVRWGDKRIYVSLRDNGPRVRGLTVNGREWPVEHTDRVVLLFDRLPDEARVEITMNGAEGASLSEPRVGPAVLAPVEYSERLREPFARLQSLRNTDMMPETRAFFDETAAAFDAWNERATLDGAGRYNALSAEKRTAILSMYESAALEMFAGLQKSLARSK